MPSPAEAGGGRRFGDACNGIAARARSARIDMKFLTDLFKHPMNLNSLLSGVVVAVAAFFTNLDRLNCHSHLYGVLAPAIHIA